MNVCSEYILLSYTFNCLRQLPRKSSVIMQQNEQQLQRIKYYKTVNYNVLLSIV